MNVITKEEKKAFMRNQSQLFKDMKKEVKQNILNREKLSYFSKQIGRNDPCFCGSGKKFKKCCSK